VSEEIEYRLERSFDREGLISEIRAALRQSISARPLAELLTPEMTKRRRALRTKSM
jgi:hypothetical protein